MKENIRIPIFRQNRWYRSLRKIGLVVIVLLALLVFYESGHFPCPAEWIEECCLYLAEHPWDYLFLAGGGLCAFSLWLRPRYLSIDRQSGKIHYPRFFLGWSSFYAVEICKVLIDIDVSEILLRLESVTLKRVYLKLHSGRLLLIQEGYEEEKIKSVAERLAGIFQIGMETIQRVGWKKGVNIMLGNYTIEKELSHGGMGKVFLARDKHSNEQVALKVLPASLALENHYVTNFAREIKILQKISHPGIVKILNVGRDRSPSGDVYFYAMEYIDGKPVSRLIESGELTLEDIASIVLQIALALDYIHTHKIIHRDIKPSNIMMKENRQAVLIDFGIARDTSVKARQINRGIGPSEVTHYVGTLPYMSPEQLSPDRTIDYRTDIYSLGVTLYEMLTKERAFQGDNQHVNRAILGHHPPEPSSIDPKIPKEFDTIVMKAMEKQKCMRYQSGAEMAEDVHRWMRGEPILSSPIGRWARTWRKVKSFFCWI